MRAKPLSYSEADINLWFEAWIANKKNLLATARQCGVDRKTIARYVKEFDWESRSKNILARIRDGVDRKIEKQEISNVKLARQCLSKEAEAYMKRPDIKGNINTIVMLMRYIDEVEGNMPGDSDRTLSPIINIWNALSEEDKQSLRENVGATYRF